MARELAGILMAAACAVAALSAAAGHADDGGPMIAVGAGAEGAGVLTGGGSQGGVNFLMRIGAEAYSATRGGADAPVAWHYVVARVRADASFSTSQEVPYVNVEFVPFLSGIGDREANLSVRVAPLQVSRDMRLNEGTELHVNLVGVEGFVDPKVGSEKYWQSVLPYVNIALDAAGFKAAWYLNGLGKFAGFDVATLNAEVGAYFRASQQVGIRVSMGGNVDLNIGGDSQDGPTGRGFALQSDLGAYAQVAADITQYVRLFLRGGIAGTLNSHDAAMNGEEAQFMAGAILIY